MAPRTQSSVALAPTQTRAAQPRRGLREPDEVDGAGGAGEPGGADAESQETRTDGPNRPADRAELLNQSEGVQTGVLAGPGSHTIQRMCGCDGRLFGGYLQNIGQKGNLLFGTGTALAAQITSRQWEEGSVAELRRACLKCMEWMRRYLENWNETLLRTEPPQPAIPIVAILVALVLGAVVIGAVVAVVMRRRKKSGGNGGCYAQAPASGSAQSSDLCLETCQV